MPTRCFMPPEISAGRLSLAWAICTRSRLCITQASRSARRLGRREHLVHAELDVVVDREPGQQAVVLEHHGAVGARRVDLAVFQQHAALVAAVRPAMMFSRVDLPQPEWPMIETYSPFSIVRLMSLQHLGGRARRG